MDWANLFTVALGAILVNNFIVAQFLGICPFMGVSKKVETASGMGLAVIFVMGLASAICWPINELILVPLGLTFMQTVTYILVIAALVQFIEMFLKKSMPSRGDSDMVTLTMTAVSPQRTTHEPFACSAYLPVSTMTFLPPTSVSNCLKFVVILHSLTLTLDGGPRPPLLPLLHAALLRAGIYKRAERSRSALK